MFWSPFPMEFKEFIDKLGLKYTITNGDLVESETGEFLVTETLGINTIYVNKLTSSVKLVYAKDSYIGRSYKLKENDCITLFTNRLDGHFNTNYRSIYEKTSRKELFKYYIEGMSLWFEDNNFIKVDPANMLLDDCIVYQFDNKSNCHVGVYIGNNNILHHMPDKLSGIDILDTSKILGVYRYAK